MVAGSATMRAAASTYSPIPEGRPAAQASPVHLRTRSAVRGVVDGDEEDGAQHVDPDCRADLVNG